MNGAYVDPAQPFDRARHAVLAVADGTEPLVAPVPVWHDGVGVWAILPVGRQSARLRVGAPVALWVDGEPGSPGAAVSGSARVFGIHDPIGLVMHGATISAALAALTARSPAVAAEALGEAARFPPQVPRNRVVLRIALRRVRGITTPVQQAGVAPALPGALPAEIRRALAGGRHVALAFVRDGDAVVTPAVWEGGLRLHGEDLPPAGTTVAAVATRVVRGRVIGVALRGELVTPSTLHTTRAAWWDGFGSVAEVDVPPGPLAPIDLPA